MSSAPELDLSRRELLRDHLETVTDLLTDLDAALDATVPCDISRQYRAEHCETKRAHPADWEELMSCGCLWHHCDSAYRSIIIPALTVDGALSCEQHRERGHVTVVEARPLKR